jgi:tripartite-type tricarboxylate transporter receptor subunit TctC
MRRKFAAIVLSLATGLLVGGLTPDDSYPTHVVRMIVASGPGGNPDILARLLGDRMTHDFGKVFVVENVTGAGGALAAITAAKTQPDGYTLMIGDTGMMAINPALNSDIGYDPLKDFTPITALAAVPTILVANPKLPASSLAEFLALARKEPGTVTYGSAGVGSIHHMTMAIFAERTGINVLHVPYRGGTAMVGALITGEVQVGWSGIPNVMAMIDGGQLRGYCISVLKRSASTPSIPTCDELGVKDFDVASVMGLYTPSGAPPGVVVRLQAEIAKLMREPELSARMDQLGMVMEEDGTASYDQFRRRDFQRYADVVRKLNLQIK